MSGNSSSPPGEEAIRVRGVEKSYGDWPVLWDLDLTVPWGQLLALFGANGVGKTTLLRILSMQTRPDSGSLEVAGFNHRSHPEAIRRRVGVVDHRTFLYEDLTCRENLVHYARLYGLKDCHSRADQVLGQLSLLGRARDRVRTLSNGMQRRLAIARAILHRPQVLLLDEPETGLDRDSVDILECLLRQWTEEGRSVVMTTHDLELGLSWAHRAAVLSKGRVHFLPPDQDRDGGQLRQMLAASADLDPP